ncbi:MAG: PTS-dependent dihydroxyacetone kinase phosphotransferase subunit DhaM [Collinsella sp.]|nr:PTS-dependent dihydroxyacetone kinase phosphotransferase subunit DhaM [Collinsella sp.]
MVGIVLVSHSQKLAEAMVDYAHMMAPDAAVVAAGGLEDGSFGTSYEKIEAAIEKVHGDDGVLVIMDMGSAVMTVKMVLEDMDDDSVVMADCPFVEGAVEATVQAQMGASLPDIVKTLKEDAGIHKF